MFQFLLENTNHGTKQNTKAIFILTLNSISRLKFEKRKEGEVEVDYVLGIQF